MSSSLESEGDRSMLVAERQFAVAAHVPPLAEFLLTPTPDLTWLEKAVMAQFVCHRDMVDMAKRGDLRRKDGSFELPLLHTYMVSENLPTAPTAFLKAVLCTALATWDGDPGFGKNLDVDRVARGLGVRRERVESACRDLVDTGAMVWRDDD